MTHLVPTAVRIEPNAELVELFHAEYADAFRLQTRPHEDARTWAAATLRGAEAHGGLFAHLVWRGLLGLHLSQIGSRGTVAGWPVVSETPTMVLLATEGRPMSGRMVFETTDLGVTWTTMLVFHSRTGRWTWDVAGRVHRRIAPGCLLTAERALTGVGQASAEP